MHVTAKVTYVPSFSPKTSNVCIDTYLPSLLVSEIQSMVDGETLRIICVDVFCAIMACLVSSILIPLWLEVPRLV
jgi:hypothetical protein